MSQELASRLDPQAIESRLYAKWQEAGYFHVPASRVLEDGADPYVIVIPPHWGSGSRGSPPNIGTEATLMFEVELLGIE